MYQKIKGLGDRIPIRLVATVLVAILIPSTLVTALGLATVFNADEFVREFVRERWDETLSRVRSALAVEWDARLERLQAALADAQERGDHLARLREDAIVIDVVLSRDGALSAPSSRPPPRQIAFEIAGPAQPLRVARELESAERFEEAQRAFQALVEESLDEAVHLESLLALARIGMRAGRLEDALVWLDRAIELFGDSSDGTGARRRLPLLLARLRWIHESGAAGVQRTAMDLLREIDLERDALTPESVTAYRNEVAKRLEVGTSLDSLVERARAPRALVAEFGLPSLEPILVGAAAEVDRTRRARLARVALPDARLVTLLSVPVGESGLQAHVFLDLDPFLGDLPLVLEELRLDAARFAFYDERARPVGEHAGLHPMSAPLPGLFLSRPCEHLELRFVPVEGSTPVGFRTLRVFTLWSYTWAVILLVLTIVVGVFYTLRYVLRETRTARLKSDFVGFISHELKTPLAAIRMFTETLLSGRIEEEEERQTCLELIDKESERLTKLIDTVLEYSRIERQQKTFRFASASLEDVVHEAVRIFRDHTKERPRIVEINAVQNVSKIQMDRAAMVELVLNLLSNADKYSPRGEPITVNVRETVDDISVEVVDRGVGIPRRDQKRIFEKFFRADDYLTRSVEGTGLGLTFARYIAKVHNGEIKVASQRNAGSTFTLQIKKTHVLAE